MISGKDQSRAMPEQIKTDYKKAETVTMREEDAAAVNDAPTGRTGSFGGLTKYELMNALRLMYMARQIDKKSMNLLKQGKSFFHIAGAGHEAAQVAAALAMQPGIDWAFPYYRDLAFNLALGVKPEDIFLALLAKADDPMTGGRQMPCHWGSKELNVPTQSSPTGTQFLQAVGVALSNLRQGIESVTYVSSGEGTTSQGEFHEAINWASREKLPVVFLIQNNRLAISVPVQNQCGGRDSSVSEMLKGYENLFRQRVDGTNFLMMHAASQSAFRYARQLKGPAIIEADVVRLMSHSSSDDQRKYRTHDEIERDFSRCPIDNFARYLIKKEVLTELAFEELKKEVNNHIDEAAGWAMSRSEPKSETARLYVYDPSDTAKSLKYDDQGSEGRPVVMVDAINHALREEMERNDKIFVFGEDVADGKGGVFTATRGLSTAFGCERVFNSPLAEASIAGVAAGMALTGLKPVVEIQFGDYIWPAFMQYRDEIATFRYRSNNQWASPVVTRVAVGGYIHGGLFHSQNIEGFFSHIPGILIAYPSNARDAKGLLKTALRLNDPVMFLEHKGLYRQSYSTSAEPGADFLIPFGKARTVREGTDLSVITYGAMVHESNFAISRLQEEGFSVELIDIRTINPLDEDTIYRSVRKCGKAAVVYEDMLTSGFGAEIAARISDECFRYLDGPVKRIASADTHIPYHPNLEMEVLPTRERIYRELKELLKW